MGSELPPAPPAWHRPRQRDRDDRLTWIVVIIGLGLVGLLILSGLHRESVLLPHDNLFHPHECLMWHSFQLFCHVT